MSVARKRPRQPDAPERPETGNVTALFGGRGGADPQARPEAAPGLDKLRILLDQAPGFMALVEGPDHRYSFSNAANNRLLGRGDLVGKTVAEALPELAEQGLIDILDRIRATGEPYVRNGMNIGFREPDGEIRELIINFVYQPVRAVPDGPVTGILVQGHDVTEMHETHARIQAQHMELIHVSRVSAMGTMASTVAHELNQPLTAITSYLSAASRIAARGDADPQLDRCLTSAQEVAHRAGKILRFLRDMTLSAIEISPVFEVDEAVRQAVELACASRPDMEVAYDIEPGTAARVDRIQFQQVMLNLIRNAQEACGDGPCRVGIAVASEGSFLAISIADNGAGFSDEELPKVFEALVTTKPRGMGVGLSVCRTIIETYGGRISAHNNAGGGAMVRFTIPADTATRRTLDLG